MFEIFNFQFFKMQET